MYATFHKKYTFALVFKQTFVIIQKTKHFPVIFNTSCCSSRKNFNAIAYRCIAEILPEVEWFLLEESAVDEEHLGVEGAGAALLNHRSDFRVSISGWPADGCWQQTCCRDPRARSIGYGERAPEGAVLNGESGAVVRAGLLHYWSILLRYFEANPEPCRYVLQLVVRHGYLIPEKEKKKKN